MSWGILTPRISKSSGNSRPSRSYSSPRCHFLRRMTRSTWDCRQIARAPKISADIDDPQAADLHEIAAERGRFRRPGGRRANRTTSTTSSEIKRCPRETSSRALSLLPMPLSPMMITPRPKIWRKPPERITRTDSGAGRVASSTSGSPGVHSGSTRPRLPSLRR